MEIVQINDGFRVKTDFHDYYFNYVIHDTKWFMLITDTDEEPVSSEIPLKSKPYVVNDAFIKKVKSKFPEYPDDIDKIDDILEEIATNLSADELKRINDIKLQELKTIHESRRGWEFITEKGEFDHVLFAQWLYQKSDHYFVRIRQTNELFYYIDGIYIPLGTTYIEEIIQDIMGWEVEISTYHVKEIIEYIRRLCTQELDIMSVVDNVVACKNGTVNLMTMELEKHSPENFIFKKIPWDYNIDAKCPKINVLVNKLLPEEEKIFKFHRMVGYTLINSYIYNRIYFLEGKGGAGKTTLVNILRYMLTEGNTSNIDLHNLIERDFMRAGLINSFANFSPDASRKPISDASVLKSLSGDGFLAIDKKNVADPINLKNKAKIIVDTNEMPGFDFKDDAIFRRVIMIHFNVIIKEKEKTADFMVDLVTKEEMEGLLLIGLNNAHAILTEKDPFKTLSVVETKAAYESATWNILDDFAVDHITIIKGAPDGEEVFALQTDLWQEFSSYMDDQGIPARGRWDVRKFNERLRDKYGLGKPISKKIDCKNQKVYYDIKLYNRFMTL
jgi:P4 family phage/plasmid primase-like protien